MGRRRRGHGGGPPRRSERVTAAEGLLPALSGIGANDTERRFVADRLQRYLNGAGEGATGRPSVDRVGALAAVTVDAA